MTDTPPRRRGLLALIGPGMLLAATGVGAGDLATAGFAGSTLGVAVAWAVVLGAAIKWVLTENLARWQLATGTTVLEGARTRLGTLVFWTFAAYFLVWSFFTARALISACGVTLHSMTGWFDSANDAKIVFGIASSLIGLVLIRLGGFRLFERVMGVSIALMFLSVVATVIVGGADWAALARGLVVPTIPKLHGGGLTWTVSLMGGVGGTVTLLCYAYWLREAGRSDAERDLAACRWDLASGYLLTGIFGVALLVIASGTTIEGRGAGLIITLADRIGQTSGNATKWIFLIGTFSAVFSSLLGVWQAVPYLFADLWRLRPGGDPANRPAVSTKSPPYRLYLVALAVVPLLGLNAGFRDAQRLYAIVGAAFIPALAVVVLVLNARSAWIGARWKNGPAMNAILGACIVLFGLAAAIAIGRQFGWV